MLIPVRCFTCGNLIADKFDEFHNAIKSGEDAAKTLDSLGIERYCCRRMLLTTSVSYTHLTLPTICSV